MHMTLKSPDSETEYLDEVRQSLLDCLKEEQCAFVQGDARFDALLGK